MTRRRRRPSIRVQLVVLAALIVAVVVASFVSGDDSATDPTAATAAPLTTSTTTRGFPPAAGESVCRTLLTTAEAEALVGRPLEQEVIEPTGGQCAWPVEQGTPLDAELFLVVKEREQDDLATVLADDWDPAHFRVEPVDGLGAEAAYVVRRPDPGEGIAEFVVGLDVHLDAELHVVLGNGARDVWEGGPDAVRQRLREAMEGVLARIDALLAGTGGS